MLTEVAVAGGWVGALTGALVADGWVVGADVGVVAGAQAESSITLNRMTAMD